MILTKMVGFILLSIVYVYSAMYDVGYGQQNKKRKKIKY